eukprot:CAMPEP_0175514078 /NCGR_PEP_ID=MMETSP0096-20121207/13243_1 /TAXON_ID=311494 /ORGANISM="Alexandrium monilatum, Strain CCMP3105" /LENGTH=82 /DNA_ID=CAMNT_0016816323 /DNA_START=232 /DNA_END=477 /DNA_ORIENTATION=-
MFPRGRVDAGDPEDPHVARSLVPHVVLVVELLHNPADCQREAPPGPAPLATAKTISRGMRARRTAESNMAGAEAEGRATGAH